jgi:C4-dicarboxylate transporter DctM subunit
VRRKSKYRYSHVIAGIKTMKNEIAPERNSVSVFFRIVRVLEKVVGILLILGLTAIVVLMTMQIINRYFVRNPFVWTEELCRYIFVWITIMGAGLALRRFELVGVHFVLDKLPRTVQILIRVVGLLGITLFIFILTRFGVKLLMTAVKGKTLSPALQLPMHIVYLIFPIGGTIMFVFAIACIVEVLMGKWRLDEFNA